LATNAGRVPSWRRAQATSASARRGRGTRTASGTRSHRRVPPAWVPARDDYAARSSVGAPLHARSTTVAPAQQSELFAFLVRRAPPRRILRAPREGLQFFRARAQRKGRMWNVLRGKSFLTHCNAVATSWRIPVGLFYNQWTGLAAVRPATFDTVHDESSSRLSQYRVGTTSKKPWQKRSVQISSVHDAYVLQYCTAYRARLQMSTGEDATPAAPPPPPNDSALRGVGCQPSVRRGNPPRLSDESTTAPRARVCRPRPTELAVLGPLIQYLVQIRDGSDAAAGHLD